MANDVYEAAAQGAGGAQVRISKGCIKIVCVRLMKSTARDLRLGHALRRMLLVGLRNFVNRLIRHSSLPTIT